MAFLLNMVKKLYVAILQFFFVYKHLIYVWSLLDLVPLWCVLRVTVTVTLNMELTA